MANDFDAATTGGTSVGTSLTWSHTCTGSDLVLFIGVIGRGVLTANDTLGITYAGAAANLIQRFEPTLAGVAWLELWAVFGPATGANNIVVTFGSSTSHSAVASSYSGGAQSGVVDAEVLASEDGSGSLDIAITTVMPNCWLIGVIETPAAATLGYSGLTLRKREQTIAIVDSNGAQTAGAHSVTVTTDFVDLAVILASFGPSTADGDGGVSAHEEYDRTSVGGV